MSPSWLVATFLFTVLKHVNTDAAPLHQWKSKRGKRTQKYPKHSLIFKHYDFSRSPRPLFWFDSKSGFLTNFLSALWLIYNYCNAESFVFNLIKSDSSLVNDLSFWLASLPMQSYSVNSDGPWSLSFHSRQLFLTLLVQPQYIMTSSRIWG